MLGCLELAAHRKLADSIFSPGSPWLQKSCADSTESGYILPTTSAVASDPHVTCSCNASNSHPSPLCTPSWLLLVGDPYPFGCAVWLRMSTCVAKYCRSYLLAFSPPSCHHTTHVQSPPRGTSPPPSRPISLRYFIGRLYRPRRRARWCRP